MDEIIASISRSLNLSESAVRSGAGIILNFLKEKVSATDFDQLLQQFPGAADLLSSAPAAGAAGSGGLLGGLLGKAGGLLGGNLSGAAEAVGALQQAGVPLDKAVPLLKEFLSQARTVAGPDAIDTILSKVPALQALLGGSK